MHATRSDDAATSDEWGRKAPTRATLDVLADAARSFRPGTADEERATRGLVATHRTGVIGDGDLTVWDVSRYDFERESATPPDSVHPSLWHHARNNNHHGLFEVAPGLWQARGYDMANISFLEGRTGWVVIDPLTTAQTSAACLALVNRHLGERPVTAVIYTHSHVDHFGGVHGVVSEEAVRRGDVHVVAPEHFLREAVVENVIAGPAMARRSPYQFGSNLPPGPRGQVDAGLGKILPPGDVGLIAPTHEITETGQEMTLDGIRMVFQMTPGGEAPTEMNFFFPDHGWLCMAENCVHSMHNLLPLRGAQARDPLGWSKYINEARELFGGRSELMFASHHWPRWGRDDVDGFLRKQRDVYRWIHDQTMRLANRGLTPTEIAEELDLPEPFAGDHATRGYYGSLNHNVKAVYQRYLGWYDGNPANLWRHPPAPLGERYVELAGGPDALLANAHAAFERGDFRWVVEVVNHLVFADPTNQGARDLQADAFEQLGYQAESATWRNAYLTGAMELRSGRPPAGSGMTQRGFTEALTVEMIFDSMAVRLDGEAVAGRHVLVNWEFPDTGERWVLGLENQALHHVRGRHDADASATVRIDKATLVDVLTAARTFADAAAAGDVTIEGDTGALQAILGSLEPADGRFNIVEP
ncbi:MAG: MBL fold metallo-hydrolase [Acidimicrobiales bacterium]|nr:MBL fold metallo-hydrolase [Acidimicrobiales bacterium]MCB1015323.1 MBL fold metallo-hydrolase [Acidimicrobiales bacterium]